MECDICLEKFDHSLNKPLVLIRCAHTICAKCVENLVEKKCPTCNCDIEETRTNWSILKTAIESDYDKLKAELDKTFNEIESLEKKLNEAKEIKIEENYNRVKIVKNHVEKQANELIKLINENKKKMFREIETNAKNLNRKVADLALFTEQEQNNETKEILDNNKLEREQLNEMKAKLLTRKPDLSRKIDQLEKFSESFSFFVNEKTSIHENFIGEIKQVSRLVEVMEPTRSEIITIELPNSINFKQLKQANLSKSFQPECCMYGMRCECTSTLLKLTCSFLQNGDFVAACVFEERGLYLFVFSADFKKQKASENLDELDMRIYMKGFKTFANKIVFVSEAKKTKRTELNVYSESLKLIKQTEIKKQNLIGLNEAYIFCYSNPGKKQEANQFQFTLYNWNTLKPVKTIGQNESPEAPFYFSQDISNIEIINGKCYYLVYRSGLNYLQIVDVESGRLIKSVEVGEDAFEIKLNPDKNLVVFNEDFKSLSYYSLDGDMLKDEIRLIDFPAISKFRFEFDSLFAFDKKNNLHFFDPNNFVLHYMS